ncbi:MAG: cation:proton antiporter [Bryobacteraceae bacterium]|nr:cation:proton antiporter [Bryobacteraceae bacterium]
MQVFWEILIELVALLAAAFAMGLIAQRLKQDAIVGHLLAGLALSPGLLGLVRNVDLIVGLAEIGVSLLLFTIGLEFSLPKLRAMGRIALIGGGIQIALTVLLAQPFGALLGLSPTAALAMGLAFSLSSTAIVLRIITARGDSDAPYGRAATAILLLQDLALAPLLIVMQTMAAGKQGSAGVIAVLIALAKALAFGALLYLVLRNALPWLVRGSSPQLLREAPVVLSIVTCLGCTWGAHALGLSPALGAFLAGALLGELPYAHQIRADIIPLRAVFVTLFFVSIGLLASPPRLQDLGMIILIAAAILFIKSAAATLALRAAGLPAFVAARAAIVVSQIGEFSFVMLTLAQQSRLLPAAEAGLMVSASVLTMLATPYLFMAAPKLAMLFVMRPEPEVYRLDRENTIIIAGYGPAGEEVVQTLSAHGFEPHIIDLNPRTTSAHVHFGDASQPEILAEAGLIHAKGVVITVPDPAAAAAIVHTVRAIRPEVPVIVRSRHSRSAAALLSAGATNVVDEERTVGRNLSKLALQLFRPTAARSDGQQT